MGKRTEIIQNRKCPKSFNICFSLIFSYPDQSVLLGSETGYWFLSPTYLEFLLIFLVYLDPNSSVVQQLVRQLLYKVFILKSSHALGKMKTCFITLFSWFSEKYSFGLYEFNNDSNFLHNPIFSQKWKLYKKSGSYQCWSFLNVPFWPNQKKIQRAGKFRTFSEVFRFAFVFRICAKS